MSSLAKSHVKHAVLNNEWQTLLVLWRDRFVERSPPPNLRLRDASRSPEHSIIQSTILKTHGDNYKSRISSTNFPISHLLMFLTSNKYLHLKFMFFPSLGLFNDVILTGSVIQCRIAGWPITNRKGYGRTQSLPNSRHEPKHFAWGRMGSVPLKIRFSVINFNLGSAGVLTLRCFKHRNTDDDIFPSQLKT